MERAKIQRQGGFTALEIMVVLTIVAILVSLAITTYISTIDRIRLRSEGRILNQTLQYARLRAISTGMPHGVAFVRRNDPSLDYYFVFMDCAGTPRQDQIYTDNNTNPDDNFPIQNMNQCGTVLYDPRDEREGTVTLAEGNEIGEVAGWTQSADAAPAKLEYVVFNNVGQLVRGMDLAAGGANTRITVERRFDEGELMETGATISPGTGLSNTIEMTRKN